MFKIPEISIASILVILSWSDDVANRIFDSLGITSLNTYCIIQLYYRTNGNELIKALNPCIWFEGWCIVNIFHVFPAVFNDFRFDILLSTAVSEKRKHQQEILTNVHFNSFNHQKVSFRKYKDVIQWRHSI
jgi:hypothetical protein